MVESVRQLERLSSDKELQARLQSRRLRTSEQAGRLQNFYALKRHSTRIINSYINVVSQVTAAEFRTMARILGYKFESQNSHSQDVAIFIEVQYRNGKLEKVKSALELMTRHDLVAELNNLQ